MAFTKSVLAGLTATDLKTLLETAGVTFPASGNDTCTGLILQIDPTTSDTVDVMGEGETEGITLTTDTTLGPPSISYQEYRISNCYLKASAASVKVKVLVEQKGG